MRIALIGLGKMGQAVHEVAAQKNYAIVSRFDVNNPVAVDKLNGADMLVDFSHADAIEHNCNTALKAGVPMGVP